jgi:hypothetical protein
LKAKRSNRSDPLINRSRTRPSERRSIRSPTAMAPPARYLRLEVEIRRPTCWRVLGDANPSFASFCRRRARISPASCCWSIHRRRVRLQDRDWQASWVQTAASRSPCSRSRFRTRGRKPGSRRKLREARWAAKQASFPLLGVLSLIVLVRASMLMNNDGAG